MIAPAQRWVKYWIPETVSILLLASARPHYVTHLLYAETRSILASREWNSGHRHRQQGWSHLIDKCGTRAYSKSHMRNRLCNRLRRQEEIAEGDYPPSRMVKRVSLEGVDR